MQRRVGKVQRWVREGAETGKGRCGERSGNVQRRIRGNVQRRNGKVQRWTREGVEKGQGRCGEVTERVEKGQGMCREGSGKV